MDDILAQSRPRFTCLCRSVSKNEIETAVKNGNQTLAKVMFATKACTGCGSCESDVSQIIQDTLRKMPPKIIEDNDQQMLSL